MADFKNNYQPWLQPNSNVFGETNFGLEDFMSKFSVGNNRAAQDAQRVRFKALNDQVTQQAGVEFMDAYKNSVNTPRQNKMGSPMTLNSNDVPVNTYPLNGSAPIGNYANVASNMNQQFGVDSFMGTGSNGNQAGLGAPYALNPTPVTVNPMSGVSTSGTDNNFFAQQQQPFQAMDFNGMFSKESFTAEPKNGWGTTIGGSNTTQMPYNNGKITQEDIDFDDMYNANYEGGEGGNNFWDDLSAEAKMKGITSAGQFGLGLAGFFNDRSMQKEQLSQGRQALGQRQEELDMLLKNNKIRNSVKGYS